MKVLITGASSGIGEKLTYEYSRKKAKLFIVARRADKLEQVKQKALELGASDVKIIVCDLANEFQKFENETKDLKSLDILIANAGIGELKSFKNSTFEDFDKIMKLNVNAVFKAIKQHLEALIQSKGRIAVIGSVQSYMVMPGSLAYCTSKYAVRGLAETLYLEMPRYGVSCTFIAPGFIDTEIRKKTADGIDLTQKDPIPAFLMMSGEEAAAKIVKAIDKRRRVLVLTLLGKFAVFMFTKFPNFSFWIIKTIKK